MKLRHFLLPAVLICAQLIAVKSSQILLFFVPYQINAVINMFQIQVHFQHVCLATHLPRPAVHCRYCDKCTEDFDHHCIWLNCCICRHNYYWFLYFTVLLYLECFTGILAKRGNFQPFDWVFVAGFVYLSIVLSIHLAKGKNMQ